MGKAPAFQFYVKDWLSDPQLRMASFQTKGIWIDILCLMWESNDRGKLTGTIQEFCKMLGATEEEFTGFLIEAKRLNFASVTKSNNESNAEVTLENRRMVRDEKARKNNALRQSRFKSNAKSNTKVTHEVTPPSSTASSSPSSNKEKNIKRTPTHSEKINAKIKDEKISHGNILLTEKEYEKLKSKFNSQLQDILDFMNLKIESKGIKEWRKQYKSDYATILLWDRSGWIRTHDMGVPQSVLPHDPIDIYKKRAGIL